MIAAVDSRMRRSVRYHPFEAADHKAPAPSGWLGRYAAAQPRQCRQALYTSSGEKDVSGTVWAASSGHEVGDIQWLVLGINEV